MTIDVVKVALIGAAAVPAVTFVTLFAWLEPWWRTPFGRHIMGYSTIVATILCLALCVNLGVRPPYLQQLLLVLYAALALMLWQRLLLLLGAHWRARRTDTSPEPAQWRKP